MDSINLAKKLWKLPRSITGDGVRESIKILSEISPINIKEYPSGKKVFDWTIPQEYSIKEAFVAKLNGEKVIDFDKNSLHLLGYSQQFEGTINKSELLEHIYTLPNQPDAIPYRTSYYTKRWGFCESYNNVQKLDEDQYFVKIDSCFFDGSLTIGEAVVDGESKEEILFSTYICHPQMANNELSGPLVQIRLLQWLRSNNKKPRYTYRFLFVPETIGSIVYLHEYGEHFKEHLKAGYVLTCIGDSAPLAYKKTVFGNTYADKLASFLLGGIAKYYDYFPTGSDERQYNSVGFRLPVGSFMRSLYGEYKEYHTSLDDLDFISECSINESVSKIKELIDTIEANKYYINLNPYCEPKLGERGLYHTLSGNSSVEDSVNAILWVLTLADGKHDLIDISKKSGICFKNIALAAQKLLEKELLSEVK